MTEKVSEDFVESEEYVADHNVVISNFEGPLDLLCFLVSRNKMSIFDVSLSELTDNYLEYLSKMQELDMEIATEFLIMGSTLVYLKSKKLLPYAEPEETTEEEMTEEQLMEKIAKYQMYKDIQQSFRRMYENCFGTFEKMPEALKFKRDVSNINNLTLESLLKNYQEIIRRSVDKINTKSAEVEKIALYEKVTIRSKILQIVNIFKKKNRFTFGQVFKNKETKKIDIVTAFLSILELSRLKQVLLNQQQLYGDIEVIKNSDKELDISLIKE